MPPRASDDPAVAALGRTLAFIARPDFRLRDFLQSVVEEAAALCRADSANIAIRDGAAFRMSAFTGFSAEFEELVSGLSYQPGPGSVVAKALRDGQVVHIEDMLADRDFVELEVQRAGGFRTDLGVPIRHGSEVIGVIAAARSEVRPFSEREIGLVEHFADQVAIAVVLARLLETIERQRTELARYAPQAAELLSSPEGQQLLSGHRREITALFADLRGFTAFAEKADPEEVLGVLRDYHATVGVLAVANQGTVEHFAGDGLMVFFNDPTPVADHQLAAVRTACAMRDGFARLAGDWRRRGYELGLGIGIATGYATVGRIGFEGRYDYAAIGTSVILASRLSSAAKAGEILISQRVMAAVEEAVEQDGTRELELKGFSTGVTAFAVRGVRGGAAAGN
ncbi:MAG TPA: adenylate/guanylate cyclase domain-containing protein [Candidatus Limnocylindrales bacterium]|nr:adenylate/guanylate cyclase domain-containing protein [Candidatus Limnocylindrales bacterium]